MPNTPKITVSASNQQIITGFANQYNVDPNVVIGMAQAESTGNQSAVSPKGAIGILQLEPSTFQGLVAPPGQVFSNGQTHFSAADINNPQYNIEAGTYYFSQQMQKYGDTSLALAAYNAGPGAVDKAGGIPVNRNNETINYVQRVNGFAAAAAANHPGTTVQPSQTPAAVQKTINDAGSALSRVVTQAQPVVAIPVVIDPVVTELQLPDNLDETPWYDDTSLVTGNPHARKTVQPVSFKIYLSQQTGEVLENRTSRKPIELRLNASLATLEVQSKHVYNRTPSRTGQHITFWGMQPDLLTGSGSTGVFMNQFGITDWFSVANVTDDIKQQLVQGFNFKGFKQGTPTRSYDNAFAQEIQSSSNSNPSNAYRVAAQDAFMEFLKMFQMNGNVYFNNPNYTGSKTGQQQVAPAAWSAQTGMTTIMQNARNNDVFSRGYVAMTFKNNVYLGYFKSLGWTMDAEKPFQWQFNFVFQVERTYTTLYFPSSGVPADIPATAQAGTSPSGAPAVDAPPSEVVTHQFLGADFQFNGSQ
jgi:hypothetical protein